MLQKNPSNLKISLGHAKIPKCNKRRAFNKAVGPEKNPKLINLGPTFIPDYRVRTTCTDSVVILVSLANKYNERWTNKIDSHKSRQF